MFVVVSKDLDTGSTRVYTYNRRPSYRIIDQADIFLEVDVQKTSNCLADFQTQESVQHCITEIAKVMENTTHG
jgi:hypothetical protein